MSLVQENLLWGPRGAVGIQVPELVLPAQDRRGEGGPRSRRRQVRGGGKGAQPPPVAPPHRDTWAAAQHQSLGQPWESLRVEGGERGPARGTEKKKPGRAPAACFNSHQPRVPGRPDGVESWAPEGPGNPQV